MSTEAHGNDDATAANGGASDNTPTGVGMVEFTEGLFTAEAATGKLKERTAAKVSHAINLQIIAAAHARLGDYVAAALHAFETGNLAEGQGLSLSITTCINTMSTAAFALGDAVDRELSAARHAA